MQDASHTSSQPIRTPLRGKLYVGLQGLRGRPVGRFLRQLRQWERLSPVEFARLHAQRLESILEHARTSVPLYRTEPWRSALSGGGTGLDAWPVLERSVLRARYDELLAWPRPRRIVTHRTSGSIGPPVKIAFTPEADTWGWAHRYRGLMWHGLPIGVDSMRLSQDRRPLRDLFLAHKHVPAIWTPEAIEQAAGFLRDRRPSLVSGPPSALFYLARCLRERGHSAPLAGVARVGGEQLFPFQRAEIERYLAARAVNSYGCTEIGALAGECPAGSMHIYSDHVHMEVFDADAPAPLGEFGDIVLTALHNPAMPLVRYRVGDQGRLSADRCACGLPHPVLLDLRPRSEDMFPGVDGSLHHGAELVERLGGFYTNPASAGVRQVQFEQVGPHSWTVAVERSDAARASATADGKDRVTKELLARIVRETFGSECNLDMQTVQSIPRARGALGKFRYYRVEPRPSR